MKKITFVISETKLHEYLSIMALSSSLKQAGHETSLVFFQNDPLNKDKIVQALKEEAPEIIAFSICDKFRALRRYLKITFQQ